MTLYNSQVIDIVEMLKNRTAQGKGVWHGEGGKLWIDLWSRVTLELLQTPDGGLTATIRSGEEEILGQIDTLPGMPDPFFDNLKGLFEVASEGTSQPVSPEIHEPIESRNTAIPDPDRPTPKASAVSPELSAQVLKKMSGRWQLDFSWGQEKAEIREDGSYIIIEKNRFAFRLVVLAANAQTWAVEVAKDYSDGRRRQIECLAIREDSMIGHAKHDGHKLHYKRIKG